MKRQLLIAVAAAGNILTAGGIPTTVNAQAAVKADALASPHVGEIHADKIFKAEPNTCKKQDGTYYVMVPGTSPVLCDVTSSIATYSGIAGGKHVVVNGVSGTVGGTHAFVTCPWTVQDGAPQFYNGDSEIAERDDTRGFYINISHFGDIWIAVKGTDLRNGAQVIRATTEMFYASGQEIMTKDCEFDTAKGAWSDCKPIAPIVRDAASVVADGQKTQAYCNEYIDLLSVGGSITPSFYSRPAGQAWFARRQAQVQNFTAGN